MSTMTAAEFRAQQAEPKPNKFAAKPITIDGIRFASRREAARYGELSMMQRAGLISDLRPHPAFDLVVNGKSVGRYTADASYRQNGALVVEDCKSPPTRKRADYQLRKRLMKACWGIAIREVE